MGYLKHPLFRQCRSLAGLSYAEVMVSMLISALFLSTTLQAYIAATSIRAKTQQVDRAIATITSDAETIRQMAQERPQNDLDCQLSPSTSYAQQLMQRVETLPIPPLPDSYQLRRILSVDSGVPPSAQVLQISYRVMRQTAKSQIEERANPSDSPEFESSQREAPIAQLHASVIPNAALVCF